VLSFGCGEGIHYLLATAAEAPGKSFWKVLELKYVLAISFHNECIHPAIPAAAIGEDNFVSKPLGVLSLKKDLDSGFECVAICGPLNQMRHRYSIC
jgi:hypothetical protein